MTIIEYGNDYPRKKKTFIDFQASPCSANTEEHMLMYREYHIHVNESCAHNAYFHEY